MLERFLIRTLINDLYKKEPKIDTDGNKIFKKSGMMFFSGILLVLIFIPFIIFPNALIDYALTEMEVSGDSKTILYICCYVLCLYMFLLGLLLIVKFFRTSIIVSTHSISQRNIFSTKTIEFTDLTSLNFTNRSTFIFKSKTTKIIFGSFTTGIIPMINIIKSQIDNDLSHKALLKATKMLKNNGMGLSD